jgi:hypothetical protein
MTIAELIIALLVIVIAIWGAKQVPPPFSYILWAFVVLALILTLLSVTHVLGGVDLGRRV